MARTAPWFWIVLAAAFAATEGRAQESRTSPGVGIDRALIVGVDRYQFLEGRTQAVSGARKIVEMLEREHGLEPGNITMLLDEQATRTNIIRAVSAFSQTAPEDRILVYFAGLGYTTNVDSAEAQGYLLPVDARIDAARDTVVNALRMGYLQNVVSSVPAQQILFLLDAALGGMEATYPRMEMDSSLAAGRRGTIPENSDSSESKIGHVITAGRGGETTVDHPELTESPFALALLSGLGAGRADANDDDAVSSFELADYVERIVRSVSGGSLHPQFRSFTDDPGAITFSAPPERLPDDERAVILQAEELPALDDSELSALIITSSPDSAQVFLDGRPIGTAPIEFDGIQPGDVTVELLKSDYFVREINLFVPEGTVMQLDAELVPNWGTVDLRNMPQGGRLVVSGLQIEPSLDGRYVVPVGSHQAEVRFGENRRARGRFRMQPGEERSMIVRQNVFTLEPVLRSVVVPGNGQLEHGSQLKGLAITLGTMVLAGAVGISELRYRDAVRSYQASRDAYSQAIFEDETVRRREEMLERYDRTLALNDIRSYGVTALAIAYGLNILDVLIFHSRIDVIRPAPAETRTAELSLHPFVIPTNGRAALGVYVRF